MKKIVFFVLTMMALQAHAQKLSKANFMFLQKQEDTLKRYAEKIIFAEYPSQRLRNDSLFIRGLVRALKTPFSFQYEFDSLATISRLTAPDSSFRIFTWQLKSDEDFHLQQGAIQMNTPDGSLKLFPLHDVSQFVGKVVDSVRTNKNWIGAVYYKIIQKEFAGKKYYTLLGFDNHRARTDRKWAEVLWFDDAGMPKFGGQFFNVSDMDKKKPFVSRYMMEYKKMGNAKLGYDPEASIIYFDHLSGEGDDSSSTFTFVPDGQFEGFQWENGQWKHITDFGSFRRLQDGQFPMDEGLRGDDGAIDEKKLAAISERTQAEEENKKKNKPTPKPKQKPKRKE